MLKKNGVQYPAHASTDTVLSRSKEKKLITYIHSQLSEQLKCILALRDQGKTFEEIGQRLQLNFTTVNRHHMTAIDQMRLALQAPWMKAFREEVRTGKRPVLPEAITTLNHQELLAMQELSADQ